MFSDWSTIQNGIDFYDLPIIFEERSKTKEEA